MCSKPIINSVEHSFQAVEQVFGLFLVLLEMNDSVMFLGGLDATPSEGRNPAENFSGFRQLLLQQLARRQQRLDEGAISFGQLFQPHLFPGQQLLLKPFQHIETAATASIIPVSQRPQDQLPGGLGGQAFLLGQLLEFAAQGRPGDNVNFRQVSNTDTRLEPKLPAVVCKHIRPPRRSGTDFALQDGQKPLGRRLGFGRRISTGLAWNPGAGPRWEASRYPTGIRLP
ncbi:hypothetical protein HRbin36_01097 [bacterium HR36]|nr:hypothetical protein HRbin36_01097 [bacterium HR36]